MKLEFYPYDFDYKVEENGVFVYMYAKLEDGTKVCVKHQHEPFFYANKNIPSLSLKDKDREAKIVNSEMVEMEMLGKKQTFYKLFVNDPRSIRVLAKELGDRGVKTYEHNVYFIHRYLRDVGIIPMTLVEAKGEFDSSSSLRVPQFNAITVKDLGRETEQDWKILAIDIETYASKKKEINAHKNPILMISFYGVDEKGKKFEKVLTWKRFKSKHRYVEFVSDEVELLKQFKEIVLEYQPDILTGYFSDGFDLPYIKTRADKYQVKMDLGLDHSDLLIKGKGVLRRSEAKIIGVLHLDIFKFIRYIIGGNLKTDSYSLDAVSEELLGHKKHDVNLDELAHIWDNEPDNLENFCAYNLHDSHLTYNLMRQLLPDVLEFTKIVGLPPFDVIRMRFSRLVESFIMSRGMKHHILAPNKARGAQLESRMRESVEGAFVFEPKPAVYKDLVVFDFRSLYPTIISAHAISPEGLNCECCSDQKVPGREKYWFCRKKKSFLPMALGDLISRRTSLKRFIKEEKEKCHETKMLEARSYALKILANSFYGYLGFYGSRWYSIESADSTTAYARDYIKRTIEEAQKDGFDVCYGDTDSVFLLLGENTLDDANRFMEKINQDLPGQMELEFEGYFPRAIFVAAKGSDKGAKKKYALMTEDGKLKITGFEFVRRNWSEIARETQKKVLELVLSDREEEAIVFVRKQIEFLNSGELSFDKVTLKTQITRKLDDYSSIGPHVRVARMLEARGENVPPGTMVEYIVGKGSGLVRNRAQIPDEADGYDTDYYLHHQLLPAVSSIFAVLGYSEDELLGKGKQIGLGAFF